MFSLSIEQFKGKNDDGGRDTEKQIIANVIGVGKGVKVTKGDSGGENNYEGPTDDEIEEGFVLSCQAIAQSEIIHLDYDDV